MITEKVDFLDDLDKFIDYIKSQINDNCEILKIHFYKKGINDSLLLYDKYFSSIDEIKEYYTVNDYSNVDNMDFSYKEEDDLKTISAYKQISTIFKTSQNSIKNDARAEINQMISEGKGIDINQIPFEEGCRYYAFKTHGLIVSVAKYDSRTKRFFLLENGQWNRCEEVQRWIIDPAYDYEIIKDMVNIKK